MDDLIRRQDAIDAIDFARRYHGNPDIEIWYKAQDVFDVLNNVPSADADWSYNEDTKQVTLVVPQNVYDSATTIFLSVGYEGCFGLRGRVFA